MFVVVKMKQYVDSTPDFDDETGEERGVCASPGVKRRVFGFVSTNEEALALKEQAGLKEFEELEEVETNPWNPTRYCKISQVRPLTVSDLHGLSMGEVAAILGVHRTTISATLSASTRKPEQRKTPGLYAILWLWPRLPAEIKEELLSGNHFLNIDDKVDRTDTASYQASAPQKATPSSNGGTLLADASLDQLVAEFRKRGVSVTLSFPAG